MQKLEKAHVKYISHDVDLVASLGRIVRKFRESFGIKLRHLTVILSVRNRMHNEKTYRRINNILLVALENNSSIVIVPEKA
jgi:hypothetical protein